MLTKANAIKGEKSKGGFAKFSKIFGGTATPITERKVIHYDGVSKKDEAGIIKLYELLVPNNKELPIDIKLIYEEGFPAFESTLGAVNWAKVQRYFGINIKFHEKPGKEEECKKLVAKLRTIENAQYYIVGYKKLLEDVAARLAGAPEGMGTIEKAKFLRMHMEIFCEYYYFAEDYIYVERQDGPHRVLELKRVLDNNSKPFYPEELFDLYKIKIQYCERESILYEPAEYDMSMLETNIAREVLKFAELKPDYEKGYISVNSTIPNQTFATVRNLKIDVHPIPGRYPMEMFTFVDTMNVLRFDDIYILYKFLTNNNLESCERKDVEVTIPQKTGTFKTQNISHYMITDELAVASELEAKRLIHMVDYAIEQGFKLRATEDGVNTEYDIGIYMTAIKFAIIMGYIDSTTSVEKDFSVAGMLIEKDKSDAILAYKNKEISDQELRDRLGIDAEFEEKEFGIVKVESPKEAAIRFAIENGFAETEEDISSELLENVVISGNEDIFERFSKGEIDEHKLKDKIGFEEEFAEMYFSLSKVDISAVEGKLLEMKQRRISSSNEMKKSALLISLYCYLIEGHIPCGPKNKVPKGNKGLKPSILRSLIK